LKETLQSQRTEIADLRAQVSQNGHKRNRETSLAVQKALREQEQSLTDMAVNDHAENKKALMRMFPGFDDALAQINKATPPPSQTSPPSQTNCAQSASEYETSSEEDDPAPARITAARAKALPVAAAKAKAPAPPPPKAAPKPSEVPVAEDAADDEASPSTVVASQPSTVVASQPEEPSGSPTAVASQNEEATGSSTAVASQPGALPPPQMSGGNTAPLGDRQQPTAEEGEAAADVAP
jgi:hypothetical protein